MRRAQLLALAVAGAVVPVLPQSDCESGTLNCAGECCDGAADQRGCNSWSPCEEPDCPWYNQLLNCAGQCCDDAADQRGCSTASPCVGREPCAGNDLILYCSDPPPECNTTVCMEGGAPDADCCVAPGGTYACAPGFLAEPLGPVQCFAEGSPAPAWEASAGAVEDEGPEIVCCSGREVTFYGVLALLAGLAVCGARAKENWGIGFISAIAFIVLGAFWLSCQADGAWSKERAFSIVVIIIAILSCCVGSAQDDEYSDESCNPVLVCGLVLLIFASIQIKLVHRDEGQFIASSDEPCCGRCNFTDFNSSNSSLGLVPVVNDSAAAAVAASNVSEICCRALCCVERQPTAVEVRMSQERPNDDSCEESNNDECEACGWGCLCDLGTDTTDCQRNHTDNSCRWANDGECDEEVFCPNGTDTSDCGADSSCEDSLRGCGGQFAWNSSATTGNSSAHVYMVADRELAAEAAKNCCEGNEPRVYRIMVIVFAVAAFSCVAGVSCMDGEDGIMMLLLGAAVSTAVAMFVAGFWISCEFSNASVEDSFGSALRVIGIIMVVPGAVACCVAKEEPLNGGEPAMYAAAAWCLLSFGIPLILWGNALSDWDAHISDCPVDVLNYKPTLSLCPYERDGHCDAGNGGECPDGTDIVDCQGSTVNWESPEICVDDPTFLDADGNACEAWPLMRGGDLVPEQASCLDDGWSKEGWSNADIARLLAACPVACGVERCSWCGDSCSQVHAVILVLVMLLVIIPVLIAKYSQTMLRWGNRFIAEEMEAKVKKAVDEHNEHKQAGLRAWKTRAAVAHLDREQLKTELDLIHGVLSKEYELVYHFTDRISAGWILLGCGDAPLKSEPPAEGSGIRASTVGQLGGGVSMCVTSPMDMGWDKDQPQRKFRENLGRRLWGQKWREVMHGEPPEDATPGEKKEWGKCAGREFVDEKTGKTQRWDDKLEVCLVLQVPRVLLQFDFKVPGRDDVWILPKQYLTLMEDKKNTFYSNANIVKVLFCLDETVNGPNKGKPLPDAPPKSESPGTEISGNFTGRIRLTGAVDTQPDSPTEGRVDPAFVRWLHDGSPAFDGATKIKEQKEELDRDYETRMDALRDKLEDAGNLSFKKVKQLALEEGVDGDAIANIEKRKGEEGQDKEIIQKAKIDDIIKLAAPSAARWNELQVWTENVARFTAEEMEKAVKAIDQKTLGLYHLVFFYCSEAEAEAAINWETSGIPANAGLEVVLKAPHEWGWDKHALATEGSDFRANVDRVLPGKAGEIEVVLILKLPTVLVEGASGDTFVVPRKSLWAENGHVPEDDEGDRWFCWTHVEKSYRLSGLPATEEALEAEPEPQESGDVEEPDEGEPPVQP